MILNYLAAIIAAYIIGSIPFGLLITKMAGVGDIRKMGSGNIGATNVLRTGNKGLALLTLLLDGGKGAVAVMFADYTYPELAPLMGLAALLGHMFPVWLKFKGGKGVATAAGIMTALAWPLGATMMVTWVAIAAVTRVSSVAALAMICFAPAYAYLLGYPQYIWLCLVIVCFVTGKHENNIKRLLKGTEPKIGRE